MNRRFAWAVALTWALIAFGDPQWWNVIVASMWVVVAVSFSSD